MKYQINGKAVEAKVTEKNDSWDTYTVTVDGEEVATISKSTYSDRKRYAGKMYGYDTKPAAHFQVETIRGNRSRSYYTLRSLKAAVEYLVNNLL
jgi:hypothetical protein